MGHMQLPVGNLVLPCTASDEQTGSCAAVAAAAAPWQHWTSRITVKTAEAMRPIPKHGSNKLCDQTNDMAMAAALLGGWTTRQLVIRERNEQMGAVQAANAELSLILYWFIISNQCSASQGPCRNENI